MPARLSVAEEAKSVRMNHWNDNGRIAFPIDPFKIAASLGIKVETAALPENTAGFILREKGGKPKIVLNKEDHEVRQRFTLAHEIGHFVQHKDDEEMGYVDHRGELASSGMHPREIWANNFAAELLMPASILKKWWAAGDSPEVMKKRLKVSSPAFAFRLKNLGLLDG